MLQTGAEIGRYRIEGLLGSGGMGQVYRAYDVLLRRHVALKVLRPDLPDAAGRLLREARAAAALSHPNAVAVYDVGEANGMTFIAMELVPGKPLRAYVGDAEVPMSHRLRWLVEVARALAAAHAKGFVHRDVKPENVMVGTDGSVKVLDFGIAKQAGVELPAPASEVGMGPSSYRTAEGRVTGTPRYMAPEQLRGDPLDGRTDQYGWGAMAYELISGVHPRALGDGSKPPEMLSHRVPGLPFEVAATVARAMAPTPELRFPSMEDVVATLESSTGGAQVSALMTVDETAPPPGDAPTVDASATTTDGSVRVASVPAQLAEVRSPFAAQVNDPAGPFPARLVLPALGVVTTVLGFSTLVLMQKSFRGAFFGFLTFVFGLAFTYLRPLFELRRAPRSAELVASAGTLRITGAGTWSQTLRRITGASVAPTSTGVSVVLARSRLLDPPISIELSSAAEATALLAPLGIATVPFGAVRWPLGRGALDAIGIGVAVAWRLAWPLMFILNDMGARTLAVFCFVLAIAMSLLALALRTVLPGPGPHVTLTSGGLQVRGDVERTAAQGRGTVRTEGISLPYDAIAAARVGPGGLTVDTLGGESVLVRVTPVRFSRRGLSADELALVASHIEAAALAARGRTMDSKLPAHALEGRDRVF